MLNISQGYLVFSVKQKLKKEYIGLSGNEIKSLKSSGVEVCLDSCVHKFINIWLICHTISLNNMTMQI